MRALFAVHVGETLGHLARALSVAGELRRQDVEVVIAASSRAKPFATEVAGFRPVRWRWSHNGASVPLTADYVARIVETNVDLLGIMSDTRPDVVAGFPGVFSAQAARQAGVPHVAFLHGPYLSPLVALEQETPAEARVLGFARELMTGGPWDRIFERLSGALGFDALSYAEFLRSEAIVVTQPGLPVSGQNLTEVGFIRASLGPDVEASLVEGACYVTFGTGRSGDLMPVVDLCRRRFPRVVVTTGGARLEREPPRDVLSLDLASSASLTGRVAAVVTHGGIGTVGTFAAARTPLLIVPTEIDQATMAVHATRAGWASQYGLEQWAADPALGRRMPAVESSTFLDALDHAVAASARGPAPPAEGAAAAASVLARFAGRPAGPRVGHATAS